VRLEEALVMYKIGRAELILPDGCRFLQLGIDDHVGHYISKSDLLSNKWEIEIVELEARIAELEKRWEDLYSFTKHKDSNDFGLIQIEMDRLEVK
jgi:hypothetical protein